MVSSAWYDSDGNQILGSSKGGPVSENILQDEYSPTLFNFTYFFRGQLNFDHPLNVDDAGYYSFNISVRLTFPDNSSTVLSNSSTYALILESELVFNRDYMLLCDLCLVMNFVISIRCLVKSISVSLLVPLIMVN